MICLLIDLLQDGIDVQILQHFDVFLQWKSSRARERIIHGSIGLNCLVQTSARKNFAGLRKEILGAELIRNLHQSRALARALQCLNNLLSRDVTRLSLGWVLCKNPLKLLS